MVGLVGGTYQRLVGRLKRQPPLQVGLDASAQSKRVVVEADSLHEEGRHCRAGDEVHQRGLTAAIAPSMACRKAAPGSPGFL